MQTSLVVEYGKGTHFKAFQHINGMHLQYVTTSVPHPHLLMKGVVANKSQFE